MLAMCAVRTERPMEDAAPYQRVSKCGLSLPASMHDSSIYDSSLVWLGFG